MSEGSRLKLAPAEWPEIVQELRAELAHTKELLESERRINAQLEQAADHYRTALEYLRRRHGKVPVIGHDEKIELARQVAQARADAAPVLERVPDRDGMIRYRVLEPRKPL